MNRTGRSVSPMGQGSGYGVEVDAASMSDDELGRLADTRGADFAMLLPGRATAKHLVEALASEVLRLRGKR